MFASNARFDGRAEGIAEFLDFLFEPVRRVEIAPVLRAQLGANASPLFLRRPKRSPSRQSLAFTTDRNSHVDVTFASESVNDVEDRGRDVLVPCISIQAAV